MAVHLPGGLHGIIPLHALLQLFHQGLRHLRQASLGGAIGHIAWSATTLDAAAHGVENVAFNSSLLLHHAHCSMGAQEDSTQIHTNDGLDRFRADLGEASSATVDACIVDPVVHNSNFFLHKVNQFVDALDVRHIAHGAENACFLSVLLLQGFHRVRAILDIANDHLVSPCQEFIGIRKAHSGGATRDDHPSTDGLAVHRHSRNLVISRSAKDASGACSTSGG
mmetsp:Transcript_58459/g.92625  ORF Transcript_58459/g.92625 Transcript_58459/m.92625 type:complete len:223 (+) Transcript_58459:410-1078(+)